MWRVPRRRHDGSQSAATSLLSTVVARPRVGWFTWAGWHAGLREQRCILCCVFLLLLVAVGATTEDGAVFALSVNKQLMVIHKSTKRKIVCDR